MSATDFPWCVPRGHTGLSGHGDPRVAALLSLGPEPAPCWDKGGGRVYACGAIQSPQYSFTNRITFAVQYTSDFLSVGHPVQPPPPPPPPAHLFDAGLRPCSLRQD